MEFYCSLVHNYVLMLPFCLYNQDGGSNGATMRFKPESSDDANNGLEKARNLLNRVKEKHPGASYADLWTFAGGVAIEEMGGPNITWRPGRIDSKSGEACPPVYFICMSRIMWCSNIVVDILQIIKRKFSA